MQVLYLDLLCSALHGTHRGVYRLIGELWSISTGDEWGSNWVWLENGRLYTVMPKIPKGFEVHFLWISEQNIHLVKWDWNIMGSGVHTEVFQMLESKIACKNAMSFFSPYVKLKNMSMSTRYTTMQQPHMNTLGHVHCSNTQRRHLKDSIYRLGNTGSIW